VPRSLPKRNARGCKGIPYKEPGVRRIFQSM
jgi:hypothetical protein